MSKRIWIDLSIINLFIVALLGMTLRTKMIFSIPFIDFNNLAEAHEHFAFAGWVTFTLFVLMVKELLPDSLNSRTIYKWLLVCAVSISWVLIFTFATGGYSMLSNLFTILFIIVSYTFGWNFVKDISKTEVSKTVRLLSISAIVCLLLSSLGLFVIDYLLSTLALNILLYRDALFTYLHLQYNGFFTLTVFALLFNRIESKVSLDKRRTIYRFSALLCISVLPSLFLSFLWQDPNDIIRWVAIAGGILVFASFIWFVIFAFSVSNLQKTVTPIVRYLGLLSLGAFSLKMILQTLTVFPSIGNRVFGDRPMIMGFLHLVFLAFVSLFILTYYANKGFLNTKSIFTRMALIVFSTGVILNETVLMLQGVGTMFTQGSSLFPWILWGISIILFSGAALIVIARFKFTGTYSRS